MVGILAALSLITVPRGAAMNGASVAAVVDALIGMHDWSFLPGPGLIQAVKSLLLGTLRCGSRLVPRIIPAIGLIGAFLLLASSIGAVFGVVDQVSPISFLAAVPIATWEISLGFWLMVKGFRSAALDRVLGQSSTPQQPAAVLG